jgi:hypothetical protein
MADKRYFLLHKNRRRLPFPSLGTVTNAYLFFIPESVTHRDRKIKNFPILVYRDGEQETDHAVPIKIIEAIVGGMVIEFGTKIKMLTRFFDHSIINGKKKRLIFQSAGNSPDCF